MLKVGLVEDGALGPTGLHQVVDGPVSGHEASLGGFGLRSVGETSLSSLLPHQGESEDDLLTLPLSLHRLVLQLHLKRVVLLEVSCSLQDTVIGWQAQKEFVMGGIIISYYSRQALTMDPFRAWTPLLCHKDTANGKKCP